MRIHLVHGLIVATACAACQPEQPERLQEEISQPDSTPAAGASAPVAVAQDVPEESQPAVIASALIDGPLPPRHAGPPPAEVFGYMRPDGVVVPRLARDETGWVPIFDLAGSEDPGPWSAVTTYFRRDSTGSLDTVSVDGLVTVCCTYEGNDAWAHRTERSPPDVVDYVRGSLGYVTTSLEGDAPFLPSQRTPPLRLQHLLDSLASWPDSVETQVDVRVTTATLDGASHTFLRAVQSNAQFYSGCYVIEAWLPENDPEGIDVLSASTDDCEGKGHTYHDPEAILQRGGELLLVVELGGWGHAETQVWRHVEGTRWNTDFDRAPDRPLEPESAPWRFDVVGHLAPSGAAVQHFAWNGAGWLRTRESLPEGSMVRWKSGNEASVLTLGPGRVGVGSADGAVVYPVTKGAPTWVGLNPQSRGWLGYFVSFATGTYPFSRPRRNTTPLPWPALLDESGTTLSHDTIHWNARTWTARLDSVSVSFVALNYTEDDGSCSRPRAQITGWILKNSDRHAGAAISYGDCEGGGLEDRRPYTFIRRGGRYFVLMRVLKSEGDDAELWEITGTEVTNVTPPMSRPN